MQKKVIDVYPPQQEYISGDEPDGLDIAQKPKKRFWFLALRAWVPFVVLLISLVIAHVFFAEGTVLVEPHVTKLHVEDQFLVSANEEKVQVEEKIIPARLFTQETETTQSFLATGQEVREEKATGSIRVFNNDSAEPQILVANTRFISEDGQLFRSTERVSVPGMRNGKPGFLDVEVMAAQSGTEYNIEPSHFSLPGLAGSALYTKIYGESYAAMRGGVTGNVSVVQEQDIAAARTQVTDALKADTIQALLTRIPPNYVVLEDSIATEILHESTLAQPGAVLEEFSYGAGIQVSILAFSETDAMLVARRLLESHIAQYDTMQENTFHAAYTVETLNIESGRMLVHADISGTIYAAVDFENLKSRFFGASRADVETVLREFPTLAQARVSLWPFWVQTLPRDAAKLDLHLSLE